MYLYQKNNEYYAQISDGMEELGADELTKAGATDVSISHRVISFKSDKETLYKIVYTSRFITRVLAPLVSFKCFDSDKLYKESLSIKWEDFLSIENTFAIFSNVSESKINHSKFASLKLKDSIADYFRKKHRQRPNIDTNNPDLWIHLHIRKDWATISIDVSGGSLHKRGYRKQTVDAPMQETLASAIINLSEWNGNKTLYDPMCGSGTLLCEALMSYCNIPASYLRSKFGFECLPDYDKMLWKKVKNSFDKNIRPLEKGIITGSDISADAIRISRQNLSNLPYGENVELKITDFRNIKSCENSIIVCNPPYNIRIKTKETPETFYKEFGDFLKQNCKNSTAYIYFGDRQFIKSIGLRTSFKKLLNNGGLEGRLVKIELY